MRGVVGVFTLALFLGSVGGFVGCGPSPVYHSEMGLSAVSVESGAML